MSISISEIQWLIFRPSGLDHGRHLLFSFNCDITAKKFLEEIKSRISFARGGDTPDRLINISITFAGLRVLGLHDSMLNSFPTSYSDPTRQDVLITTGDIGNNAPENWWGGAFDSSDVHCMVHVYARTVDQLDSMSEHIRQTADNFEMREYLPRFSETESSIDVSWPYGKGEVHFGFKDGFSQPRIVWEEDVHDIGADAEPYCSYKEFMVGQCEKQNLDSDLREIFKHSTYGAFRMMQQHMWEWDDFLNRNAECVRRAHPNTQASHEDLKEFVAAKMFGRWRDGTPLVLSDDSPDCALASRHFTFKDDPEGRKCPITSHIRLANPRGVDNLRPGALGNFEKIPRLIRRGIPFGPAWDEKNPDDEIRGLAGLFLTGNLRGFEMIMNWLQDASFNSATEANEQGFNMQDPIMGNRIGCFNELKFRATRRASIGPMPQFVSTIGALNVIFPSKDAIDKLISM